MAKRQATAPEIHDPKLVCPIRGSAAFWTRRTVLNTALATFSNLDWENRHATNFISERCGHVRWFAPTKRR